MSKQYGFFFNGNACIQCHSCEVACKSWRDLELGVSWRRVIHKWYGQYPEIKDISISIACMHCLDPECVKACPEEAIEKASNGVVIVDQDKCIGCGTCLDVCPFGIPQFGSDGKMQKCDMCINAIDFDNATPPCVHTCPTKALGFGPMSTDDKVAFEKSLMEKL